MRIDNFDIHKAILKGEDNQALEYLYKIVLPKIRSYIVNNNGNKEEADDIFQDVVISLYRKIKTNEIAELDNIEGYIYLSCKNLWINRINKLNRRSSLDTTLEFEETSNNALHSMIDNEKKSAFKSLIAQVGERCKELLYNVIYNQLNMDEIAEKMSFANANAAKTHHYRCKQKLAELVENDSILKSTLR